jgi:hypothetical protein
LFEQFICSRVQGLSDHILFLPSQPPPFLPFSPARFYRPGRSSAGRGGGEHPTAVVALLKEGRLHPACFIPSRRDKRRRDDFDPSRSSCHPASAFLRRLRIRLPCSKPDHRPCRSSPVATWHSKMPCAALQMHTFVVHRRGCLRLRGAFSRTLTA